MKEIEDTSGRASADPEVVIITSPRETSCNDSNGECSDELLTGDPVEFRAYLRNSGDADLDNMQYSVGVYIDENGNRGQLASDGLGNDLSWNNYNAVCVTSPSCQNPVLAAGDYLDASGTLLKNFDGTVIEWTPSTGSYFIVVEVTSNVLGDPGNNEQSISVKVRDYYDVAVDLTWMSQGSPVSGSIEGNDGNPKDYQLSVSLDSGIPGMTIRDASVRVDYSDGSSTSFTVGVSNTVNVQETVGDSSSIQTGTRLVIGGNNNWVGVANGSITPPTTGQYSVTATLTQFVLYGAHGDSVCGASSNPTAVKYCEKTLTSSDWEDEYPGSNVATIDGSIETFHDLSLVQFQVWIGLDSEDPEVYGSIGIDITSTLSPGEYELYAEVGHVSSNSASLYNWSVDFTIADSSGNQVDLITANSCDSKVDEPNTQIGTATVKTPDAEMLVYACATVNLGEGDFSIEADANLLGQWDEQSLELNDRIGDMSFTNNRYEFDVSLTNFAPQILSLDINTETIVADTSRSSFIASASVFDVEGDSITYQWTDVNGVDLEGCEGEQQCEINIDESMTPTFRFNLYVEDSNGGYDTDYAEVSVLNMDWANSTEGFLADDLSVSYSMVYRSTGLSAQYLNSTAQTDISLPGYDGEYSSVAGFVMTPAGSFDTSDILEQSMTVQFKTELEVTSMWLNIGTQWLLLNDGTPNEVDADFSSYTYEWSQGSSMPAPASNFYLFNKVLTVASAPEANISGFKADATIAGGISIDWAVNGTMLSDERVVVSICESDANCSEPDESRYDDTRTSILYAGQNTVHGNTYYVTASICDGDLCSNEATATVVADKEVAGVTATDLTITESGETWVLNWNASSVDSDIASWLVCYLKASFTASEMNDLIGTSACVSADNESLVINKYSTVGTYDVHFSVVPVDVVGNTASSASMDSVEYTRSTDNTNPGDGEQTTDTEASSGVPTWTWGVIGIIVVVAFVAGAFILSRGDDGEDEGKDWDY
ncbi:MAG: hypothetical protein HN874_01115 [Euryarchaeota archaeon]|nr:hypothetical protein [Euryarchaeota archaeon]